MDERFRVVLMLALLVPGVGMGGGDGVVPAVIKTLALMGVGQ